MFLSFPKTVSSEQLVIPLAKTTEYDTQLPHMIFVLFFFFLFCFFFLLGQYNQFLRDKQKLKDHLGGIARFKDLVLTVGLEVIMITLFVLLKKILVDYNC